jgi:hypothetical protein
LYSKEVFILDIEEALSKYLETYEADDIFNAYFSAIRKAFFAGYKAGSSGTPIENLLYIYK